MCLCVVPNYFPCPQNSAFLTASSEFCGSVLIRPRPSFPPSFILFSFGSYHMFTHTVGTCLSPLGSWLSRRLKAASGVVFHAEENRELEAEYSLGRPTASMNSKEK